ncbi:hypothetical protein M9458_058138 [Cirrhinus mrigala]|uniref:Tyr recombinase domain-containing protein n=1 Tax=Cirrhinus mrigala TaxID=683832 RepID=A0ABD0MAL7_CIRMR
MTTPTSPYPGREPGTTVHSDASVGPRVDGTHNFTKRAYFLTSGASTPSSLFEQRLASSDPDSEVDIASAGTREEGKHCPVQSDFSPGRFTFWDQSPSASPARLPHRGHVGQRSLDSPRDQAGDLASASQPLAVVDSDGTSRLCDSVRPDTGASFPLLSTRTHMPLFCVRRLQSYWQRMQSSLSLQPKSGFYSPYFIVPKKSGGLRPILDLRALNRSLLRLPFKMLTMKRMLTCIRHQDWFAANACSHRHHCDRSLYQAPRWSSLPSHVTTRPPSAPVESEVAEIAMCRSHSRRTQPCSRPALTAVHPSWRMATPPPGMRWPPGPKYAFPPVSLLAQTLCKIREDEEQVLLVAPYWPTRTWFPDLISLAEVGAQAVPFDSQSGLREAPFEPLASVELKHLSLKTALLTALASIKRVGDLQAFSVDEACLEFGPGDSHVILRPRPGYVPKVPTTPFRDQVVNLQALPLEEADPASALLCPVRALRIYVDRTRHFRRAEQLFVCFGGQQKGNAVSKQRLAHWVVDAISLSYQNQGEPCPLGVHAHSTRSVASSYALAHGASLADICRAAGWATSNTFARFYNLRVEAVSSRVLT